MESLSWGIVSAGNISHDFVNALSDPTGPAASHNKVLAVTAQEANRAKIFAEKHKIPKFYGCYETLAADPDIDIVYVGNTTAQHYDVCKLMLESGKHVLVEKTMTHSASHSQELYEIARSRNLFIMEGLWSNFFPAYRELQRQVDEGMLGDVILVECSIGGDTQMMPRIHRKDLGGGAALSYGVYAINVVRLAFKREQPLEIIARGELFPSGVDSSWNAVLVFPGNRRAVISCYTTLELRNTAVVTGTKGSIEIPKMWAPTSLILPDKREYTIQLPSQVALPYNYPNSAGLAYEAASVSHAIRTGKLECGEFTAEDSLYIARILDEISQQLGVKF